jgi:hypothetical protein
MNKNYLQHDFGSRNNQVLLKIRRHYGMEGIGVYWCLTEMLFEAEGIMPLDIDLLSYDLRSDSKVISGVIDIAFAIKDNEVFSQWVIEELAERLEAYNKKTEAKSKAGISSGIARRSKKLLSNINEHVLNTNEHVFEPVEQITISVEQNELREGKISEDKQREDKRMKVKLSQEKLTEVITTDVKPTEENTITKKAISTDTTFENITTDGIDALFDNII